jgi:hypothetical protein
LGTLLYGGVEVDIEDRMLAHVQIVIVQKFRRSESFVFSWLDAATVGGGRSSLWMHPYGPVYFKFLGSRTPVINREWLNTLTSSADSSVGLVLTDESGTLARAGGLRKHGYPAETYR